MPVSLIEWRVRIGRFFQNPPDSNKQEMIQRFLERWKVKKEKTAASTPGTQDQTSCQSEQEEKPKTVASPPSTQDQTPCHLAKEDNLKTAACPLTIQDQTPCKSAKEERLKTAPKSATTQDQTACQSAQEENLKTSASPPSTQDQVLCESAKKEKPKKKTCPPATQNQTPCESAKEGKPMMAASPQPTQTPCTPSCTPQTILLPSSTDTGPVVMSSVTQVFLVLLTLMTSCFHWCRKQCSSLIFGQLDGQQETAEPLETTKVLSITSQFSTRLPLCKRMMRMISYTMGGFFCLYLPVILLMRSGDVETNPGPNSPENTVSNKELLKLAREIPPCYYMDLGISLGIPYARLQANQTQPSHNSSDALLDVFMKWNVMQQPPNTNKREVLADALRENDLGDLAERLLPEITGGPSRSPESQTQPPPSESETPPLSPELIERCANDFKFKYRSTLCKIRADPLDPASLVQFEDMYTNLVLEGEHRRGKRAIDYNDLLDLTVNGQFPKRLMVQGEAGAGKTTLCSKIAWDWIEEKYFKKFVWVLIVHLRDAEQYTLGQIAKSYLAKNNPATACQLAEYIRSNPGKVFIAFDGLDEFSARGISKSECHWSQPPAQPSRSRADIRIVDILCSVELASCPVLVTTRPWRAVEIRSDEELMELYTFIHVEGFSRDNLSVYIHKYFAEDNAKANQLIQFMDENDVISENMAHYPIYVAMLCLMWKELDEQKLQEIKSLQTFSQIFKEMIGFLKEHYAQKKVKKVGSPSFITYRKEINKLLEPVAEQAFTGLLKNTLVFSDNDFHSCPESMEAACHVGILSQEDRIKTDCNSGGKFLVHLPVFFPHKLFQEYMAGVYLASLYESNPSEFSRLIGDVVLPRKEEFRYLLYFTVSQNKTIAHCVMESMTQSYRPSDFGRDGMDVNRDFIVDVAFESQDPGVAAFLKDKVPSQEMKLRIDCNMTAHTVAGYAFTRPPLDNLVVLRDCGPTMSLDVVEIICSIPSLKTAALNHASFHDGFYTQLAQKGREAKVQKLYLEGVMYLTLASSHHLAVALCSMPSLTDLTLNRVKLTEEFCCELFDRAPSLQLQTLKLEGFCYGILNSYVIVQALSFMPHLNGLTLEAMALPDDFCNALRIIASSLKIQTLSLKVVRLPKASYYLAMALCSMPQMNDLTLHAMDLSNLFCDVLKHRASFIKVETLELSGVKCPSPDSSHDLAEALCSMPHLTNLTLHSMDTAEFYSALKAKVSTKGSFPQIRKGNFRFNGVLQEDLNFFLHSLEAFSRRRPLPSHHPQHQPVGVVDPSYQIHPPSRTSQPSDHPQQQPIGDVDSSDQTHPPRRSQLLDDSQQQPIGDVDSSDQMHPPRSRPSDHPRQQSVDDTHSSHELHPPSRTSDHPQQQPISDVDSSDQMHPPRSRPSDHSRQQSVHDTHSSHELHPPRRTSEPLDHPQQQPMGVTYQVHPPERTSQPLDLSRRQPIGDFYSSFEMLSLQTSSLLDLSKKKPTGDVDSSHQAHPLRRKSQSSSSPLDLSQRQPIGDVESSYQVQSLQTSSPLDLSQKEPTGDMGSSDHVHPPIITSQSSELPQQPSHSSTLSPFSFTSRTARGQFCHGGSSSDTVGQFSHTYSEGSCSQSRSRKRPAPSTQSRVPQEDPEIPEKQPKTGV